jgi:hypothetical protein
MQTVSLPYRCSAEDRAFLDDRRRLYSTAVWTAYANAVDRDGAVLKQTPLRDLVKFRFTGGVLDAWALALEEMELRKRVPDGRMVFGGRKNLDRRQNRLLEPEDWKRARLQPMKIRGDKNYAGNRHFRLSRMGRAAASPCFRAVASRAGLWSAAASR